MKNQFSFLASVILLSAVMINPASAQQDSSSVEWIKVYFGQPADHSVALPGNRNRDRQDLIGTLQSLIDSAQTSVDLAIYDLEQPRIGRALARAVKRGVRVRIVTDNDNRNDAPKIDSVMWRLLRQAHIPSIDDDGDIYEADGSIKNGSLRGASAFMHNKFAAIDVADNDPSNDVVWTGSANLTYTGAYNTNHTIVIKDSGLAREYDKEFEQMWGEAGAAPNPDHAVFHKDKRAHHKHIFFVDTTRVVLYFAPVNRNERKPSVAREMTQVIKKQAQHDVAFEAFAISANYPVSREIWDSSARGQIKLKGVIDHRFYAQYKNKGVIWATPAARRGNRLILPSNELRKLHSKVILVDAASPDSSDQGVVFTGSYNFSTSADRNNDENSLFIYSDKITNQFYQDFMGVMSRAQGKTYPPSPPLDTTRWYKVNAGEIESGNEFSIDVAPGFDVGVRLLGVETPSVFAAHDSADYFSGQTRKYLIRQLKDASVKLSGPYGSKPIVRYGSFRAYVTVCKNGRIFSLNHRLLKDGMGRYVSWYTQHPDSVQKFKHYQRQAKQQQKGLWQHPDKMGTKISRSKAIGESATSLSEVLPVNINTADAKRLELLPGIGAAYAGRIIKYRKKHHGFSSVDELRNIRGIGPKTMARLRPNVVAR